jgi:hypothetical protein
MRRRQRLDVKGGCWQDIYSGAYGKFVVGAELEFMKRSAFTGVGGAPSTHDAVGFTPLRYYF